MNWTTFEDFGGFMLCRYLFSFSLLCACTGSTGKVALDDVETSVDDDTGTILDTGSLSTEDSAIDPNNVDNDGDGMTENQGDCDDSNASVYLGAEETCDGLDNNCDTIVDNNPSNPNTYYQDLDQDVYGKSASVYQSCDESAPIGYAEEYGDCNDNDDSIYPNAPEECDGIDNDCDGNLDNGVEDQGTVYYQDLDGDGYGSSTSTITSCVPLNGYSSNADDCDDTNAHTYPGAPELCDDEQNDCSGTGSSDGKVTFIPTNGAAQDITAQFASGLSQNLTMAGEYHFCSGTFPANMTLGASASLIGHDGVILEGTAQGPILAISSSGLTVSVESLVFDGGVGEAFDGSNYSSTTGGIACNGFNTLSITDSVFQGNVGGRGGAAMFRFCTVDVSNSTFGNNQADYGGGIFIDDATVEITNSIFTNNIATTVGGGLYSGLTSSTVNLSISDSSFSSNQALYGGGIGAFYTNASFIGVTFDWNTSSSAGGGLFFASSTIKINTSQLKNGDGGGFGGGMYMYDSTLSMTSTTVDSNSATYGGGLVLGSDYFYDPDGYQANPQVLIPYTTTSDLNAVHISNNSAFWGGGIYYISGTHMISDSVVESNHADDMGGGIIVGDEYQDTLVSTSPTLDLVSTLVSSNSSLLYSGMLLHFGANASCTGSMSETSGFLMNTSTNAIGSIFIHSDASFESQMCDFGNGTTDNAPIDLSLYKSTGGWDDYSYGDDESFVCAADICGL